MGTNDANVSGPIFFTQVHVERWGRVRVLKVSDRLPSATALFLSLHPDDGYGSDPNGE